MGDVRGMRWAIAAVAVVASVLASAARLRAEDVSQPAILQWFEATYSTMENRAPDMFLAGYGTAYTPPPGRADTSNSSVGYDVYDRFDLGKPGNPTLYGTEAGLKQFANVLHRFDGRLDIDAVLNHNALFGQRLRESAVHFISAGGRLSGIRAAESGRRHRSGRCAGYVWRLSRSEHGRDYLNGQLSGLIDIDHATNWQLIRQPVAAGNPQNIPAGVTPWVGRLANVPDPNNARFYPDQNLPGVTYYNPSTGQNETALSVQFGQSAGRRCGGGKCDWVGAAVFAVDGAGDRRRWFSARRGKAHAAICA